MIQDKICVKNILCYANIGVGDRERDIGQRLSIDLEAFLDLSTAGKTNELSDTVSYVELSKSVSKTCLDKSKTYKLIEYLGSEICGNIFSDFSCIAAVKLTIRKPHIPDSEFNGEASIEIFRDRKNHKF